MDKVAATGPVSTTAGASDSQDPHSVDGPNSSFAIAPSDQIPSLLEDAQEEAQPLLYSSLTLLVSSSGR
jgi:hypothetical protein